MKAVLHLEEVEKPRLMRGLSHMGWIYFIS